MNLGSEFKGFIRLANLLMDAPDYIERDSGQEFYGWRLLHLCVYPKAYLMESRSVYADPTDDSQDCAILRTVSWDRVAARRNFFADPENFSLTIPCRYVKISLSTVSSWLAPFDNTFTLPLSQNHLVMTPNLFVKLLRIQHDLTVDVYERIWRTPDKKLEALDLVWNDIWNSMTHELKNQEQVKNLQENFQYPASDFKYDDIGYSPDVILPMASI